MTEQPGAPDTAGAELTDAQKAFLDQQAAAHAVQSPSPAAAAAATMGGMVERGPTLPAEDQIEQMMALFKAQSEQLEALRAQVGVMQKQADEATAASGGPPVIRYAKAAGDYLRALVVAHPDVGADHFKPALDAAEELNDAATELSKNGGSADTVTAAAAKLDKFINRTHWRKSGKPIDFSLLQDHIDTALEEAEKLAA
jgi:hypothetical protein